LQASPETLQGSKQTLFCDNQYSERKKLPVFTGWHTQDGVPQDGRFFELLYQSNWVYRSISENVS
jgi:hypothetical protein